MTADEGGAQDLLERFLDEMARWDRDWHREFTESNVNATGVETARSELADIFSRCVADDAVRRNDLIDAVSPTSPSQYADAGHRTTRLQEDDEVAVFEVQLATGLRSRFRYFPGEPGRTMAGRQAGDPEEIHRDLGGPRDLTGRRGRTLPTDEPRTHPALTARDGPIQSN